MEQARLNRLSERIPTLFSLVKERQCARLDRMQTLIVARVKEHVAKARHQLDILHNNIVPLTYRIMIEEKSRLAQLKLRADALDPQRLLERGYSITLFKGKVVKDASKLREGDEIETVLNKGRIKSIINTA